MRKIKKVFSLIAIIMFLCQSVAFCIPEMNSTLRPPLQGSLAREAIEFLSRSDVGSNPDDIAKKAALKVLTKLAIMGSVGELRAINDTTFANNLGGRPVVFDSSIFHYLNSNNKLNGIAITQEEYEKILAIREGIARGQIVSEKDIPKDTDPIFLALAKTDNIKGPGWYYSKEDDSPKSTMIHEALEYNIGEAGVKDNFIFRTIGHVHIEVMRAEMVMAAILGEEILIEFRKGLKTDISRLSSYIREWDSPRFGYSGKFAALCITKEALAEAFEILRDLDLQSNTVEERRKLIMASRRDFMRLREGISGIKETNSLIARLFSGDIRFFQYKLTPILFDADSRFSAKYTRQSEIDEFAIIEVANLAPTEIPVVVVRNRSRVPLSSIVDTLKDSVIFLILDELEERSDLYRYFDVLFRSDGFRTAANLGKGFKLEADSLDDLRLHLDQKMAQNSQIEQAIESQQRYRTQL